MHTCSPSHRNGVIAVSKKSASEKASDPSRYGATGSRAPRDGELAVEPVVHQEEIGWLSARDRRGEPQDQIIALGEGDQLGIHRSLRVVETRDDGTVRVDLLGIAGDHHGDPRGVGASLVLARDSRQQEHHPGPEPEASPLPHHTLRS